MKKIECETCGEAIYPNRGEVHDCMAVMKKNLKEAREEIASLKAMLAAGGQVQMGQMPPQGNQGQQAHPSKRCPLGHPLYRHSGQVPEYNGSAQCDGCRESDIDSQPFFYRCQLCQFDLCRLCCGGFEQPQP